MKNYINEIFCEFIAEWDNTANIGSKITCSAMKVMPPWFTISYVSPRIGLNGFQVLWIAGYTDMNQETARQYDCSLALLCSKHWIQMHCTAEQEYYRYTLISCGDPHIHLPIPKDANTPSTVNKSTPHQRAYRASQHCTHSYRFRNEIKQTSDIFWSIVMGSKMRTGSVTIDVTSEPI